MDGKEASTWTGGLVERRTVLKLSAGALAGLGAVQFLGSPEASAASLKASANPSELSLGKYNMNADWKFYQPVLNQGPLATALAYVIKNGLNFYDVNYDEGGWENVSLPHTFTADDMLQNKAASGGDRGIYQGVVFYRKHFKLNTSDSGKKVFIEFEGIRQAGYVYLNGELLGYYESGVTAFGFDLSAGNLKFGDEENVLAVAADNRGAGVTWSRPANNTLNETIPGTVPGSNSGSGFVWNCLDFNPVQGGLNRNVNLYVKDNIYQTLPLYSNLRTKGTYIYPSDINVSPKTATINVSAKTATINVETEVRNETDTAKDMSLDIVLMDDKGKIAYTYSSQAVTIAKANDTNQNAAVNMTAVAQEAYQASEETVPTDSRDTTVLKASFPVKNLHLWSTTDPYLYDVYSILKDANGTVDVVKITTGFRKAEFKGGTSTGGVFINDKFVWLPGYAQRSSESWATVGTGPDWLIDKDMALLKESNANYIRWMHIAPQPADVRASDKYGVAIVCPAGDKEAKGLVGRQWNQRLELMRDAIIYFRNSPSVFFWEIGNGAVSTIHVQNMVQLKQKLDPSGMRVIGCRSLAEMSAVNAAEYVGTMLGRAVTTGGSNYTSTGRAIVAAKPVIETEYSRDEAPRRVWDRYSPPNFDYVDYFTGSVGATPPSGRDAWDYTAEEFVVQGVANYNEYYSRRMQANSADPIYSAAAAMCWSDGNWQARQTDTETGRMSGRVDEARILKQSFYAYQTMQSTAPSLYLLGHWNYPTDPLAYWYYTRNSDYTYSTQIAYRNPLNKTIYVIASHVAYVELFINGVSKGIDNTPTNNFLYSFNGIDITQSGEIHAIGYNSSGVEVTRMKINTVGDPTGIRLTSTTGPDGLRADGSDIAYVDVEVVDNQGQVHPLNYDKINYELVSGDATILGGYNSGCEVPCQRSRQGGSSLLDEFSSGYNKSYVYAENGVNRLFIRAGHTASDIVVKVWRDGFENQAQYVSISSKAFAVVNGLSTIAPQSVAPSSIKK